MFAEHKTEFEIDVDTNSYRLATRFSKFHNMPELTSLLAMIADFHQLGEEAGVPEHDGYDDTLIMKTRELSAYLKEISHRADDVRSGNVSRTEDNMLKITTDGRKAALDLRLVDPEALFSYASKVGRCAENVADIYYQTMKEKSTQLVFCDISTPKTGFNIYDDLRERLVTYGIPEETIAFIHDAETAPKRTALFKKVRSGEIRILLGSTFKLGLGVNVQDRLIALHHIDVPWRPADMTQREGRILRQGNRNPKVHIYRYITEGSFDAYSWQLLETKQRFINDLLSGSLTERDSADIEDTVLDYAEVKALAIGNPLVKERVEAQNELSRFLSLQHKSIDTRLRLEKELMELPSKIAAQEERVEKCVKDADHYRRWKEENAAADPKAEAQAEEQRKLFRERLNTSVKENSFMEKERFFDSYRGFDLILPAGMDGVKPYIWISHEGRYRVEMGDTQLGNLMRIDHFLEHLNETVEKLKTGLCKLTDREKEVQEELARNETYAEQIETLRSRVESLDEELGVNKE
jgi:hypothetical protein